MTPIRVLWVFGGGDQLGVSILMLYCLLSCAGEQQAILSILSWILFLANWLLGGYWVWKGICDDH